MPRRLHGLCGILCRHSGARMWRFLTTRRTHGCDSHIIIWGCTPTRTVRDLRLPRRCANALRKRFIVDCRAGIAHNYDIVEGPMADDTIYNFIQGFIDGKYSRAAFWELARFKYPTHRISFHTARALTTLRFIEGVLADKE